MSARRPLSDRIAEARDRGPKPVNYERIQLQAWGPSDALSTQVKLLRGRVLVEPLKEVSSSLIVVVEFGKNDEKSLAIGRVVAMGPPMFRKNGIECPTCHGVGEWKCEEHEDCSEPCEVCPHCWGSKRVPFEIQPGFEVGDVVLHIGQHRSRDVELADGVFRSVAQEEVQGVVKGNVDSIDVRHGGAPDHRTVIR